MCIRDSYYASILGGGLGPEVIPRAYDWGVSPFGIYQLLIVRGLTGVEVPLDRFGFNNVAGSIQGPFTLDYFWTTTSSLALQAVAIGLFLVAGVALFLLLRTAGLLDLLRRRAIGALAVVAVIGIVWVWYFVPAEVFRSDPMEPILKNTLAVVFTSWFAGTTAFRCSKSSTRRSTRTAVPSVR